MQVYCLTKYYSNKTHNFSMCTLFHSPKWPFSCKGEDQISFSSTVPLFLFRLTLSHKNTCIMQTTTSKNIMLRAASSPIIFVRKKDFCFCEKIQENKGTNCHHKWNYLHEFLPVREFSDSKTQEQDFFQTYTKEGSLLFVVVQYVSL